jgi:gamma-glutamyltranspeptidase/glutathione hydrolase
MRTVFATVVLVALSLPLAAPTASPPVPERAERGMVVAARAEAAEAGVAMLRQGGNAVDAAVATGFALAVVHPTAGNLGGGGFLVLRQPDGTATTIDHREEAPAAATPDVYLDAEGHAVRARSRRGALASGVPGTVAGLLVALDRYGTLPRATVLAPAIRLAEEGFRLSGPQARRLNGSREAFAAFPSTLRYFAKDNPNARFRAGERFVQSDLAAVLRRIAAEGRRGFYAGRTAELIVQQMEESGGLMTRDDLARYEPVERAPVTFGYRGHRVISMGPPSSGGVALAQLLGAVEPYRLDSLGLHASGTVHLMAEAMRRTYADRARWLGDADFVDVPVDALIDSAYVQRRMASFEPQRVTPTDSVSAGEPMAAAPQESMETTHYSVVDAEGRAVSVTTTINSGYGSKLVVDGAGFFLNNEMNDFALAPGVPNLYGLVGSEANAVAPGKRMLSSMTPTIVEDAEGRLLLVVGSPGGSTIITSVFQTLLNVIDHGMDVEQAVTAGRVHHQWKPEVLSYERHALPADVRENLRRRGWTLDEGVFGGIPRWGDVNAIRVRYPDATAPDAPTRVYYGGADPRRESAAVGF